MSKVSKVMVNLTDCGFRLNREAVEPCCHCGRETNGRNETGEVAVCYRCYHNVNYSCHAHRCGEAILINK